MGLKVIQLDDTQVSILLTGLMLVHNKYFNDNDKESAVVADTLIDFIKDSEVFVAERSNRK